jgi:hypothetical protein
MGKILAWIMGAAGGIAGLLPMAPWIIAGIVALVGTGGALWIKHDLDAANADRATKQAQIELLNRDLGSALAANKVDEATIEAMQTNNAANDALIEAYQHQADEDARASADAGTQLRNLQNADADVATYLSSPIPPALRSLLNHEPVAAPGSGHANQNGSVATPKAKRVP